MTIEPETKLGRYEIRSKIGEGGMGEVYLARDMQLDRVVALKILSAEIARDQQRLYRFLQEARAASKLKSANVAHIYEIGEVERLHFIAMEYVEGEPLNQKIGGRPMEAAEIVKLGIQIARALDEAHSKGITHRDIKPQNIIVTSDAEVKMLDFGLAKLSGVPSETDLTPESELATKVKTSPGIVMGTINYMAPEQAMGRDVDHRTDIFSFGVVLYEMATGRLPFTGASLTETIDRIAHAQPEAIARFNYNVPAELEVIIKKALRKNRDERYQSARDLLVDLRDLERELEFASRMEHSVAPSISDSKPPSANSEHRTEILASGQPSLISSEPVATSTNVSSAEYLTKEIKRHKKGVAFILAALVVAVAAVAFGVYKLSERRRDAAAAPFRAGKIERFTMTGKASDAVISPDGKYVAYVQSEGTRASLWVRFIATNSDVQIVAPAEGQYRGMTFSPEGNYIYYVRTDRVSPVGVLYQIAVLGGSLKRLATGFITPVTVSPDGKQFAFVRFGVDEDALVLANADGTGERNLAVRKRPEAFAGGGGSFSAVSNGAPAWSPDGKIIACPASLSSAGGVNNRSIALVSVADGSVRPLTAQHFFAVGRIAWLHDASGLVVVMRDDETGQLNYQLAYISYPGGEAHRITRDVNIYGDVSVTDDAKALVTVQSDPTSNVWLVPFAQPSVARQITSGKLDGYAGIAWTPDGRLVFASRKIRDADLWVMNADGGEQKQFMDDTYTERYPSVTPDGHYIVFDSLGRGGGTHVWRMDADGGNLKQLTAGVVEQHPQVSPDGQWVVYSSGPSVWKVSIDGGQPVRLTDKFTTRPRVSPDGKLVACFYRDAVTSLFRLAIIPFEGGDPVKVFDTPVGAPWWVAPRWTPDGRAILYADDRSGAANIWSQPVAGGQPVQLTDFTSDNIYSFDLSRDGRQLALARGFVSSDVVVMSESK